MTDAKFKLEDILNKKKAPPQILDLANTKIETEEEFKNLIEKIPDYRIKAERPEEAREQIEVLAKSMRRYKKFRQERRRQYVSQIQTATTDLNEGVARLEVGVENDSDLLAKREDEKEDTESDMRQLQATKRSGKKWQKLKVAPKLAGLLAMASSKPVDLDQQQPLQDHPSQSSPCKSQDRPKLQRQKVHFSPDRETKEPVVKRDLSSKMIAMDSPLVDKKEKNPEDQLKFNLPPGVTALAARRTALFYPQQPYQFADPCPDSMRGVKISDLSSVDINWKMLTLARPASKTDEEIFSKLVQLDKLRLQTRRKEAEHSLARGGKDPFIVIKNPSASKGGVAETSIKVCSECSEEFCSGTCKEFQYEAYQRFVSEDKEKDVVAGSQDAKSDKKKRRKKKMVKKKKTKGRPTSLTTMPVDKV